MNAWAQALLSAELGEAKISLVCRTSRL